ncbi:MAG TPA: ring-cleaving dioxygenase [Geminicoccaceae bacterium]|nr:ring-cleaving dioxygenase [Geminicoccaceae bacterium]
MTPTTTTPAIEGLHHITAISGPPQRNLDFYAKVLGLRFVKRTVNFDDPSVYHLYYGDAAGTPGTVLTFFPWERLGRGRPGIGEASLTQFAVPPGSLPFWRTRLEANGALISGPAEHFGEGRLLGEDPDGLNFALVVPADADERAPWTTEGIDREVAIRGFHGVTLTLADPAPTAALLEDLLGYEALGQEAGTQRFAAPHAPHARIVDIVVLPDGQRALQGRGSVHHIAFAVADRATQLAVRERLVAAGYGVTPVIDRNYFYSIYFRSPGGVLFEIATAEPGFAVDEPVAELGQRLKLPAQHEHLRAELERTLPPLML